MILSMHTGLCGYYTMTTRRRVGKKSKRLRPGRTVAFPNLITDAGLNAFGSGNTFANACYVGTSSTPPTVADVRLNAAVGSTTNQYSSVESRGAAPEYWLQRAVTFRFAAGAAAGNLAEVGVGVGALNSYTLFSRALIVDGAGNPTVFTVLPDEILDVTYSLRMYPKITDTPLSFLVSGTQHTGTLRPGSINQWQLNLSSMSPLQIIAFRDAGLAPITSNLVLSGTSIGYGSPVLQPYVAGTFYRDTLNTFILSNANHANGITGAVLSHQANSGAYCVWQAVWSPPIRKDATKTLTLTVRQSWGRYAP